MKKLAINIFIVLLMLVCVDISIAKIGNYLLKHVEKSSFYGEIQYAINEATPDVLIVGASRAKSHYVPQVFIDSLHKTVYNAGSDGKNIFYHSCIINAVFKRKVPDMIILELAAQEFQWDVYDRLSVLNPFYTYDSLIKATVDLKSNTEWVKMKSNLYRYNSRIFTLIYNCYMGGENKYVGYRAIPSGGVLPVLDTISIEGEIDTLSVNRFKYVLHLCKINNIPLIVVVSPYYRIMYKETRSMIIMKNLCKKNNVPFLNYSKSSYFLQHPEMFRDNSHLNNIGAKEFTILLVKQLQFYQSIANIQ